MPPGGSSGNVSSGNATMPVDACLGNLVPEALRCRSTTRPGTLDRPPASESRERRRSDHACRRAPLRCCRPPNTSRRSCRFPVLSSATRNPIVAAVSRRRPSRDLRAHAKESTADRASGRIRDLRAACERARHHRRAGDASPARNLRARCHGQPLRHRGR